MNPFTHVINDFGLSVDHQGFDGAAFVLLSVMASVYATAPNSIGGSMSAGANPYAHVFTSLAAHANTSFVRELRQRLNAKVQR